MSQTAKVLLVDDRRDNLLALEAILQGLPVVTVGVHSGEEALKQLLVDDFALILLDAQMPEMDGFETARHIKRRERTRHVPIIFLTAALKPSINGPSPPSSRVSAVSGFAVVFAAIQAPAKSTR